MWILTTFYEESKLTKYLTGFWTSHIIVLVYLMMLGTDLVLGADSSNLPSFRNTSSNFTYSEGEVAVLYCSIQNLGTRTVTWRRTMQPSPITIGLFTYDPDERYKVHFVKEKDEWNLFIKNVKHEDAGMYECQISSKERYIRKLIQLNVVDQPYRSREIRISRSKETVKGGSIVLTCNATGGKSAPHDLDWIKDSTKLISSKSGRIHITKHISYVTMTIASNLTIKSASPDDSGTYTCRTSDDLVRNITIDVSTGASENVKRTISQDVPVSSSATSSKTSFYVIIICVVHCSSTFNAIIMATLLNCYMCMF